MASLYNIIKDNPDKKIIVIGAGFEPDMDAEDADVFFQYVVMGELVFG